MTLQITPSHFSFLKTLLDEEKTARSLSDKIDEISSILSKITALGSDHLSQKYYSLILKKTIDQNLSLEDKFSSLGESFSSLKQRANALVQELKAINEKAVSQFPNERKYTYRPRSFGVSEELLD